MLHLLFALLIVEHYLADYPLQGDFRASEKNRSAPILGMLPSATVRDCTDKTSPAWFRAAG